MSAPEPPLRLFESPRVLFWIPTLIWASTWHVILYQLDGGVPAIVSVGWRFALASMLLFALAIARGEAWRIAPRWHAMLAATGLVQYAINYWGVYEAERHVPTGLVAVLFSLMVFGNALLAWWWFGQRVSRRFFAAATGGVVGVVLIFWPEVVATGARPQAALGLAIGLGAVACACVGNLMTLTLSRRGLALVPVLAWGMGYAALALLAVAAWQGHSLRPGQGWAWSVSLVYLAAFGSVTAFLLYFKLAQGIGAARAAMTGVMIPPIALVVSATLEGWRPTLLSFVGVALCVGSVYVATRPSAAQAA
jgi:drug/metabolite transporter (DMT)-like permease